MSEPQRIFTILDEKERNLPKFLQIAKNLPEFGGNFLCQSVTLTIVIIDFVVSRKNKVMWMTCLIVAAYILCWSPYYVLCIYFYTVDYESFSNVHSKYYFLSALIVFNSVINPFLYGGISLETAKSCYVLCKNRIRTMMIGNEADMRIVIYPQQIIVPDDPNERPIEYAQE